MIADKALQAFQMFVRAIEAAHPEEPVYVAAIISVGDPRLVDEKSLTPVFMRPNLDSATDLDDIELALSVLDEGIAYGRALQAGMMAFDEGA